MRALRWSRKRPRAKPFSQVGKMNSMTSKGGARRKFLERGLRLGAGAGLAALLGGWSNATRAAALQLRDTTLRVGTYKGGDSYYFNEAGVANLPYKIAPAEFAAGNLIVEALSADSLDRSEEHTSELQ